jgi:hypothetical protein
MVIFGAVLYRSGAYIKLGNIYWEQGGSTISAGLNETNNAIGNVFENIWVGLLHIDRTVIFALHGFKVRTKMTLVMLYNNMILIKDQIVTGILTLISKTLSGLLNLVISIKKSSKTAANMLTALPRAMVKIAKKLRRDRKEFESSVIEEQKDKLD